MWHLLNIFRRDVIKDLLNGRITIEDFYRRAYFTIVFVTVVIFAISLAADVKGFNGLNIVLIPVWVIIVGYFGFHPTYILLALTTGGAASLGRDADRQRIIDGIKAAGGKWKEFFLHGAMFGGVFFLTRFLMPIREYPFAGMLLLGAVITLGLWAWIYVGGTWYKRYALGVVLVSIAVSVFGTFAGKPTKDGHPTAPMASGMAGIVEGFTYSRTIEIEVATLQPHTLCGVRPGKRKFVIPKGREVEVFIRDAATGINNKEDITSTVRVNKTVVGESFMVDSRGCVEISFAVNGSFQKNQFVRQIVALTFK